MKENNILNPIVVANDGVEALEILHLEDSPLDAELIYEHLCENFCRVVEMNVVSTEKDFVFAIKSKKYDLIISDFQLPSFDGFAALEYAHLLRLFVYLVLLEKK